MTLYWLLYLVPSTLAFFGSRKIVNPNVSFLNSINFLLLFSILILTLFIGFRHEVGGDWVAYLKLFNISQDQNLFQVLSPFGDPGYQLINYFSGKLGFGIYGVNFFCALVFSIGLIFFCNTLPRPMLAIAISIPYMVVVVSMGYTRQALALGIMMMALMGLRNRKNLVFVSFILVAATVHKTAILILPLAAVISNTNRIRTYLFIGITCALAYFIFLEEAFSALFRNYIQSPYQSQGALIRLFMSAVPATILLIWFRRFNFNTYEEKIWKIFSWVSLILFFTLFFISSMSTAIDRIGLYLLPLQLVVFSNLPDLFGKRGELNQLIILIIILYYAAVMFVWLNFAFHSQFWLPYQNIILNI